MIEVTYRGLPEFGLTLIAQGEPGFDSQSEEIRNTPRPFGQDIDATQGRAAVLENQSRRAVITLHYVWRYTTTNGETRTSSHISLGSSKQMDVLMGRAKAAPDLHTFLLPGARRLITEDGMFRDNRDVVASQAAMGGGSAGSGGGRRRGVASGDFEHDAASVELFLDIAIFEDGLCVGPDEFGLQKTLTEQMQTQLDTAGEIVRALRDGATPGRIFEMLLPLVRHGQGPPSALPHTTSAPPIADLSHKRPLFTPLLSMFARSAVHTLMAIDDTRLLAWFEAAAASTPLQLHRPQ